MLAGFFALWGFGVKGADKARQGKGDRVEGVRSKGIGVKVQVVGAGVAGTVAQAKRRRPLWVRTRVT